MIFEKNSLICPYCEKCFIEPKVLPCGENACSKCLPESGCFDCLVCTDSHETPKNGFPNNKILFRALEQPINFEKIEAKNQEFKANMEYSKIKLDELKSRMVQLEAEVIEHCKLIINQIDLNAEEKINLINNNREDLIKMANEYQDKCLSNLTKYTKNLAELSEEVNFLIKDKDLLLNKKDIDEKLEKYYYVISKLELSQKEIRYLSLDNRQMKFEASLSKDLFGNILFKNLKKKNLNELDKHIVPDFLDDSIVDGSIKLKKLENGNIIFCYKQEKIQNQFNTYSYNQNLGYNSGRQAQKIETYKFIIKNLSSSKTLEITLENKYFNLDVKNFENFVFLTCIDHKYIKKYDSNLALLKTVNLHELSNLMLPTKKFVLVYLKSALSGSLMNIYDLDLNFVITIKNNMYNSFLHIPSSIKQMFANDKYYYFQEFDNSITVVNQENGTFFKKISPDSTNRNLDNIVKITNDFIIITYNSNKFEFRNSNGELSDEIEYDSKNLSFVIDDMNQIFLMNNSNYQLLYIDKF